MCEALSLQHRHERGATMFKPKHARFLFSAAIATMGTASLVGCYGNRMDGQPMKHLGDYSSTRTAGFSSAAVSERAEAAAYKAPAESSGEERTAQAEKVEPGEVVRAEGGVTGGRGEGSGAASGMRNEANQAAGGSRGTQGPGG